MNGGSRTRVTSAPFRKPNCDRRQHPARDCRTGDSCRDRRRLAHHDRPERHHHAARQIDARGEDDQRLADGDDADDHHLLKNQREVRGGEEAIALRSRRTRQQASSQRPSRGTRSAEQPVPMAPSVEPLLRAPARIEAERGVPAVHAFHRLVGNQRHAGVDRSPRPSCRSSRSRQPRRRPAPPSSADTAATWRRCIPALTFRTPAQPPSTDTMITFFSLPGCLERA